MNLENLILQVSQISAPAKTLKPYQGLKRPLYPTQKQLCGPYPAKTLKPYQGLKHLKLWIFVVCNTSHKNPKTVSGIEIELLNSYLSFCL
jgi:hypothetical protein